MTILTPAAVGLAATAAGSALAVGMPQEPNTIAGAILLVGGALTTVVVAGFFKLVRGVAQWQKEMIETMAGAQLSDLVHVKRMHEECERRGVELAENVAGLKADIAGMAAQHKSEMVDLLSRNREIEANMSGLCLDLLRASGHLSREG